MPHVGLPNILLGKAAVPELLQHDAVPEKLAQAVADWYDRPEAVAALEQDFHALHLLLKKIRLHWRRRQYWKKPDFQTA